ncbi:hypothetical protein AAG570_003520 [Ranatra chinensis]|uniref:TOG domain-containing protein n=1 Tax=Ranatra chinensis TaxID=642074 RepID=A0ABD0YSF0_9HEMI
MEPRGGVHSTPLRHVQRPNSSGKLLELTPLWETVLRYDRLPQSIDKSKVFSEMSQRLNDPEWEVRQHALRVLADLVPVVARSGSPEDLDNYMIPLVLTEVTYNLGHPAPAVRRSALDVLSVYLRSTSDAQFVLRSVVTQGLESPAASGALAMSVIVGLPRLIESTLAASPSPLSHQTLVNLVTGVSKKLTQMSYQTYAVSCMIEIRDRIGESRFDHFLESYYPQVKRDFDVLCKVYQIESPSVRDSGIDLQSTIESPPPSNRTDFEVWSDSSNSPTVINEPVLPRAEIKAIEDVPQTNEIRKDFEENPRGEEGRVVLEREIQFNENTAITMRILEEEENKGKNLEVEEPEESGRKTPRRVRFGGEVVKLRTPDSDITAREENKGANEEKDMATPCVDEQRATEPESFEVLGRGRPRSSHIPLPVVPALNRPSNAIAVRTRGGGLAKKERGEDEEDIPTMDGGDSLTSSSEGEPARRNLHQSAGQLPAPEALLRGLSFLGPDIIQLLQKKVCQASLSRSS